MRQAGRSQGRPAYKETRALELVTCRRCTLRDYRRTLRAPACVGIERVLLRWCMTQLAACRGGIVFRPPWQATVSATAPERLQEVPVLEERPAATRTCKARHSASRPGNRGHPGECNYEKWRVLEKQIVQQIGKQKHSGDAAIEQQPENRGPAPQITPCRLERETGGQLATCPSAYRPDSRRPRLLPQLQRQRTGRTY